MPDKAKHSKREAILNAMLNVVVEGGFHDAPMSLIAERAGASPGVIYHHFRSKQDIIQAVYEQVRAVKLASFLKGYSPQMEPKTAFIHVWLNLYEFHRKHKREMRFFEQYELAGFVCNLDEISKSPELLDFERRFRSKSKGGVLADWAPQVLQELTSELVARLAKQPQRLPPHVLRGIAEKMWEAVRASDENAGPH